MDGLFGLRIDDLDHGLDQRARGEVLAGARLDVLGVAGEQAFVDVVLDVDGEAEPGLAVDEADEAAELGGVLDLVLRLEEDGTDDAALTGEGFEQLAVGDAEFLAGEMADVGPAGVVGQQGRFAHQGDALVVHLEGEEIGDLGDIGLIGDALVTQDVGEVPELTYEGAGVHGVFVHLRFRDLGRLTGGWARRRSRSAEADPSVGSCGTSRPSKRP